MTKSTWAVITFFILMVGIGAAIVYRSQLKALLQRPAPAPVATTTPNPAATLQSFATTTFSLRYQPEYTLNTVFAYDQFGPKKLIHGISLTIPLTMATGTNLASDTYISVEQLPRAKNCTGDIFVNATVVPQSLTDSGVEYSLATTSGAGAGNLYEEQVYARVGSTPCTAVRYYIHSGNIGNYPAGAVREFDRAALLAGFDQIRRSLALSAPAQP
jgi:hypothetical protein